MQMLMKCKWLALSLTTTLSLLGCGGGAGGGGSGGSTGTTSNAVSVITLNTSAATLNATAGSSVTVTATAKTAGGVPVQNVPMSFQVSCVPVTALSSDCANFTASSATTSSTGQITVTIDPGSNIASRSIVLTATSGSVTTTTTIAVNGASLTASRANTGNATVGGTETFTFTLKDAGNVGISGRSLDVLVDGVTVTTTAATNASGQVQYTYTVPNQTTAAVTARVSSATQVTSAAINLVINTAASMTLSITTGVNGSLSDGTPVYDISTAAPIVTTPICNSVALTAGQFTLALSSTLGTIAAPNSASTTITSSLPGYATVTANVSVTAGACAGATLSKTALVYFQATTATSMTTQASPTSISVNTGTISVSSPNQSSIIVTLLDANNSPVRGKTVTFSLLANPSGGLLTASSATSDQNGQAIVKYVAGATATALNGVQIQANATVNGVSTNQTVNLTVGGSAYFVTVGTGNTISAFSDTAYQSPYVVTVVDASGNPVSGASVTVALRPTFFAKGLQTWNGTQWVQSTFRACANEDLNFDGLRQPAEPGPVGGPVRPGQVPAIAYTAGQVTNASGLLNFTLIYPKNYAYWAQYQITVTGVVSGSQGTSTLTEYLRGLASDYTTQTVSPPGQFSPYGIVAATAADCNTTN